MYAASPVPVVHPRPGGSSLERRRDPARSPGRDARYGGRRALQRLHEFRRAGGRSGEVPREDRVRPKMTASGVVIGGFIVMPLLVAAGFVLACEWAGRRLGEERGARRRRAVRVGVAALVWL